MFFKKFLIINSLLLLALSFGALAVDFSDEEEDETTQTADNEQSSKKSCKCYCSYKCGPRDATADDDPFFDKELGICFCKQRDKDAYIPHKCYLKKNSDQTNCCGSCKNK